MAGATSLDREPSPLEAAIWPGSAALTASGELVLGGLTATELARNFATPSFIFDEQHFRDRARLFIDSFAEAFAPLGTEVDVYYAGKSFLSIAVARWAHEEGMRVDACTGGELSVALRAQLPGEDIGLHGSNKSDEEIARAIDARVGRIVIDSHAEIARIASAARAAGRSEADPVPVMVRVTTGVHAGGHDFIATAHEDQKFGLSLAGGQALAALEETLRHPELTLLGVHAHIGSQIQESSAFEVNARALFGLRADLLASTGYLLPEVDLGGGYGIAYVPGDVPLGIPKLARALAGVIGALCAELGTSVPRLSIEPGRAIVGPCGVTLYTVGVVKRVPLDGGGERTYVSVDGGLSDNMRAGFYNAVYTARLANRTGAAETVQARIVGKHCETDTLIADIRLPADIAPGDLLAVPATGAYGRAMANNYNHVLRPPVVAVKDRATRVIVRRETEDDLFAVDLG